MHRIVWVLAVIIFSNINAFASDTLKVVTYNLLNFPNGYLGSGISCTNPQTIAGRWDTLKKIMNYIQPDILICQELQTEAGADSILIRSLNTNGVTKYKRAAFIFNQSNSITNLNNMCFYNSEKVELLQTKYIKTGTRDCGLYKMYAVEGGLAIHKDTTFLDVLCIHTKAGQTTLDSQRRAQDCKAVMDSIKNWHSADVNMIIGGDMNLYTSAEGAFVNLTTGLRKFNDPLNAPGAWESNASFAYLHTQATRNSSAQSLECGATGGMDSRLDFLLASDPIMNNTKRIQYISGSYKAVGNGGNSYNKSINDATNNSGVPTNILTSMYNMSDHVPVEMKLKLNLLTPASINDISKNQIKITPIPFQNNLVIEMIDNNTPVNTQVLIYDLTGRVIYRYIRNGGNSLQHINTTHWTSGMYIISIEQGTYRQLKKIIKVI